MQTYTKEYTDQEWLDGYYEWKATQNLRKSMKIYESLTEINYEEKESNLRV